MLKSKKTVKEKDEQFFQYLSAVLESHGYELIKILSEDDNELGKVYEILYKTKTLVTEEFQDEKGENKTRDVLREVTDTDIIVQHFSSSGINWVWLSQFEDYKAERRAISLIIQELMKLPKEEKIKQSAFFVERLAEFNPSLVSQMLNAY
ncbi:hypothetical protein ANA_C13036 [Anabaena sp. 90]|jgi:hypothetical protein|uniref:hypothetical protein n=1 Tax=Anabaena sp. 90 TaxID=46234 RepID=UPI00029B66BB|nr:hypothetical protein [Anabaena sp. 90]AFW95725.1 hypothetical protein ANA_C13036 [Anabaena sp. 90]MBO1054789.1 hypothetical protein [Dolichospermum sp. DET73]